MTDLISEVYSSLSYLIEPFTRISSRYVPAILANVSSSMLVYVGLSVVMVAITVNSKKPKKPKSSQHFDIGPDDEVIFESSVTKDEIDEQVKKNTPGTYIPLDSSDPKGQLQAFLGDESNKADLVARVKQARQAAIRKKIEDDMTEDEMKTEQQ